MISKMKLSRLLITGTLDLSTPYVVLQEIASAHQVDLPFAKVDNKFVHQNMIDVLNESGSYQPEVSLSLISKEDLSAVATFVNKDVSWDKPDLLEALEVLKLYMSDNIPKVSTNFPYGLQVPANPYRLNACVLYKICKKYYLPVQFRHTLDEMATAIHLIFWTEEDSRRYLRNQLPFISSEHLADIYLIFCIYMSKISSEENFKVQACSDLETSIELLDDKDALLRRIRPQNKTEAIVLAAKLFRIDISLALDPISEYENLTNQYPEWIPKDQNLRNKLSLSLDTCFNPHLPKELYNPDHLIRLALLEGYLPEDLIYEKAYSLLVTAYLSETFYPGRYDNISNNRTPFSFEDVNSLDDDRIVCWGSMQNMLYAFTYQELSDLFNTNKNFSNPIDKKKSFSKVSLRKLKRLCQVIGDTKSFSEERSRLFRSIELTELFSEERNSKIKEFYLYYQNGKSKTKAKLKNILQCFLKLSMYCRGWSGKGPFPIEEAVVESQGEVDINVSQSIYHLRKLCKRWKKEGKLFLALPLTDYQEEWFLSNSALDGCTIDERLSILAKGESHSNLISCMRSTSNWFAASAYRYLTIIGESPPFDIKKLRAIY